MNFTPVRYDDIPRDKYSKQKIYRLLELFRDSDCDAAEITWEPFEYKSAESLQGTICASIKRFRVYSVKCVMRKGKVFLLKVKDDSSR